jgi:hypothetical protein
MTVGMISSHRSKPSNWQGNRAASRRDDSPEYQADKQRREQLVATARATDLVQLAGRYSQLRRKATGEYEGPCPKCGGDNRFTVDAKGWFCRTCKPYDEAHGWYGAIDFVMWITGLNFVGAVGWLTGAQMTAAVQQRAPVAAQPERTEPDERWRMEAEGIVTAARVNLYNVNLGGAEYLDKRGLEPGTWQAFNWGWAEYKGRAAIVMPWYRGGKIMAIRYRYIEPTSDGQRLIAQPGSKFTGVLYGGQAMEPGAEQTRTLVLCEGEINAASIWQVAHDTRLDVLSVGSESTRLTDPMLAHAAKYKSVVVWMDRREIAAKMREQLPAGTVAVSSPLRKDDQGSVLIGPDGKPQKWDANDLLRIGKLGAFLAGVRAKACGDDGAKREGLLWDLVDAARLPLGIDPGTGAAALRLAGELGKKVTLYECPDGAWRVGQ